MSVFSFNEFVFTGGFVVLVSGFGALIGIWGVWASWLMAFGLSVVVFLFGLFRVFDIASKL